MLHPAKCRQVCWYRRVITHRCPSIGNQGKKLLSNHTPPSPKRNPSRRNCLPLPEKTRALRPGRGGSLPLQHLPRLPEQFSGRSIRQVTLERHVRLLYAALGHRCHTYHITSIHTPRKRQADVKSPRATFGTGSCIQVGPKDCRYDII